MAKEKQLKNEIEVLEAIGAKDFRSISKDQIITFVSSLPKMDKQLAIKCIEQFGNFKDFGTAAISQYYEICNNALNEKPDKAIEAHREIIRILEKRLHRPFITKKEKQFLIEKIVDEGNKISELQRDSFRFKHSILKTAGEFAIFIVGIGGVILTGGKIDFPFGRRN